jgi:hypothetical protein
MRTAFAFRAAEVEQMVERSPMSNQEGFIYEILWLCPVIPLTSSYKLRKIKGIQKQKEKRLTRSLPSLRHQNCQPRSNLKG